MREFHTDISMVGGAKVTGLPTPSGSSDAVPKSYVDGAIEAIAWKDNVRAASTANVTVSGPGTSIDGVTLAASDRVLLKSQTTASENGIYIFTGSGTPMTRAADASTFDELESAVVGVDEGTTNAGTWWRQTAVNGTIGSTSIAWSSFMSGAPAASESAAGIAEIATQTETDTGTDDLRIVTPAKLKASKHFAKPFEATFGDGSATSFNFDHNFNTRSVVVECFKNSGNYDTVIPDVTRPSANRVTLTFASAPASNAMNVVIMGKQN